MSYPNAVWERAMAVQEVIVKALSGAMHWFRAADILGWSRRTLRRWRERYEQHGYLGLVDTRRHSVGSAHRGAGGGAAQSPVRRPIGERAPRRHGHDTPPPRMGTSATASFPTTRDLQLPAADPTNAFVTLGKIDLGQMLCHQEARLVARDNTVAFEGGHSS